MNWVPLSGSVVSQAGDALAVGIYENEPLAGAAAEVDSATGGVLQRLREAKEITGKANEVITLLAPAGVQAQQVVVVGLGKRADLGNGSANRAAGAAARLLAGKLRNRVVFALDDGWNDALVEAAVCGAVVGCTGQDLYRAEKKRYPFGELAWRGGSSQALHRGLVLGESVNLARRLVNEPPSHMTPTAFAAEAQRVAHELQLACEVWDQPRLEAERCGSLLAVARGSAQSPRLVILHYAGGPSDAPPLALVGKGVTFDSGGLSLKPSDGMLTMKCDMSGAASVLAAVRAIALLKLPVNVIGLCGLVENMLGGNSYKLGDVLTARSGKTIEIHNTDAEGRLVLADVLDVAVERKAAKIIDLATLTGACVVALGTDVAGLMTNNQPLCERVMAAAQAAGEPVWQLPMFAEFGEQIRGEVADIKNVGEGRWGGAITAAKFLEEFVQGIPWVHCDIAGPAFLDKPKPWLDAGGAGALVRTLVELARSEAAG